MKQRRKTVSAAASVKRQTPITWRPLLKPSSNLARRSLKWAVLGVFCLLSTLQLSSQEHGAISGTVLDATGSVVPGAKVTVTRADTGRQITANTNGSGAYAFPTLPPALYSVKVVAPGFAIFEESNVALSANQSLNVSATLTVGSANETIQVEGAVPGVYAVADSDSATRTNTPVIDIPQSIQIIARALIVEQDTHSLADALLNVSGVVPAKPQEIGFVSPLIHGFPAEIYQDGLPSFGATQSWNDPTSLAGVKRIDVLKGPSSALYGGGLGSPLGGLINVVSEDPATSSFSGSLAMRGGSYSTIDPYGDVNVPLSSKVAARVSGEYLSNESWMDEVTANRWSIQPRVVFHFDPNTSLLVQGLFNHRNQLEYSGLPAAQALAGQLDRNAFPGAPIGQPYTTTDTRMATVDFDHAFTDSLRWSTSARYYYGQFGEYGSFVFPALYPPDPATPTVYPILTLNMPTNPVHEEVIDTNLVAGAHGLGGHHELLAGASYDHTNFASYMGFSGIPVGEIDLAHPVYNLSFGPLAPLNLSQTDRYATTAVYGQDQATYGRLHLMASLRYTQLEFREREQSTDQTYHHASPRVGATIDVTHGVALYAGYATAFRASFGFFGSTPPKPETSQNIEGGVKLALAKYGLSGTISGFDQTRNNVSTPDPGNPFLSVQTGQQRAFGAETDIAWEPIHAFSLLANYAYTEATVTQDNVIPVGNELARVPRNSGRIAARYRVQHGPASGLAFGAGMTAFGARQDTLPNTVTVPGYAAVDAQAAYNFGHRYSIEGSAVNLANRHTYDSYEYFGFPVVMPNQPLSAYVTLKIHLNRE